MLFNQVEEKNIMQAIILAAGMGKRLGELTKDNTKCMVEVGGVKLIERALQILDKKNLSQIILVVGYQYENLMTFVDSLSLQTPVNYIVNDVYYKTNNIFPKIRIKKGVRYG